MWKEFANYHLSDESFLYVLHSISECASNARWIIDSGTWRIFLMDASNVERELLRLHQYRKLHYEVAGSLAQLKLPYHSTAEYARELCA